MHPFNTKDSFHVKSNAAAAQPTRILCYVGRPTVMTAVGLSASLMQLFQCCI